MVEISLLRRSISELIGTYVLVFLGTGSVVTAVLLIEGAELLPGNTFSIGLDIAAWFAIGIVSLARIWRISCWKVKISGGNVRYA